MEVAEPPGLERVTVHYQQQQDGSVLVRAVDALTFLREHPLLIGARLNLVRTQVRDTESAPYLVVTPTTGAAPRPRTGGSRKRRVDDRKQLTPLGLEAAQRRSARLKRAGSRRTRFYGAWCTSAVAGRAAPHAQGGRLDVSSRFTALRRRIRS